MTSERKFTLRQCLPLCLPALILGAVLRLCLLAAEPEGFYGSDSPSYFEAAAKVWSRNHGNMLFTEKRRWLYPLLLVPLPILPAGPARTIPLFQHLLGLATLFGIGWIAGNLTRLRSLWVPVVTVLAAISPKILWYEQEVVSEPVFLAAFVLTVALAMPPGALKDRKRLFWFLLAAAAVAATKPHGRGVWLGCVLCAIPLAGNPLKWGGKCWGALAAAALIMSTSGEKQQADWLLLSSTLPLVNLEAPALKPYRDAIRPLVLDARRQLDQFPWNEAKYKKALGDADPSKIDPVWASLASREKEFSMVCLALARGAIWEHPFWFARFTFTKIGISFADRGHYIERMDPQEFWKDQDRENSDNWSDHRRQLQLFYNIEEPQYAKLSAERRRRRNAALPFLSAVARRMVWMRDNQDPVTGKHWLTPCWPGVLALLGFLTCLAPGRFVRRAVLWLPASLCLISVHAIGDHNVQYVETVEWLGFLLIAVLLDAVVHRGLLLMNRVPREQTP